MLCGYEVQINM